jgi:hypothetical protein
MSSLEPLSTDEMSLLSGHEDDFYGLWEVDWHFNGHRPEWSHGERAAFVAAVVKRGFFEVFFGPLHTERPPLELDVALKVLADPAAWAPPADGQGTGYYVTTNSVGVAALRTGS